jgi:hypothetical protein
MFEGTTITKANPASFSFTVPLTAEKDESIVMDLISDLVTTSDSDIETQQLKSFDMYVQTGSSTFKTENCVVTGANFAFSQQEQFKVDIEGEGIKLTRVGDESYNLGTIQPESTTRTPILVYPAISISGLDMNNILSVSVQIQNNIEWVPYETLQSSLAVTNSSNAMFPSAYTVSNRVVSGTIQQYQTENNITQFNDFSTNTIMNIAARKASDGTAFWNIRIDPAMYTARMEVGDVYTQSYDYRSIDNTALGTRITQYS